MMTTKKMQDFFYKDKLEAAREQIENLTDKLILVYGVGASLVCRGDILDRKSVV